MRVIRILAVLAIAATFGLAAGCGGDDDDEDTAATEATTTGTGGGATGIRMTEYAFDPRNVRIRRGDTITVTNHGDIPHNYTIADTGGVTTTGDVDPQSGGEVIVDVDPAEYDVICTIPGHAEQGMKGTLTVEP